MAKSILGIHHITAICSDAQRNVEFYSGLLGLRLVKRTVNFDDPGSYHLYYGNGVGYPGTIMTFFAWPGAGRGRIGNNQVTVTSFAIPVSSIDYWLARLKGAGISVHGPSTRFGDQVLAFNDPDGLALELITRPHLIGTAIYGFHSATLSESDHRKTADLLTRDFGFAFQSQEQNRYRYASSSSDPGNTVDIVVSPDAPKGRIAVGTVHHIAWRTPADEEQKEWLSSLTSLGFQPSPVTDRTYFQSIYFREPGGILFEIATDHPGFTFDESADELGTHIKLPPWLEKSRTQIEHSLPPLKVPVYA